VTNGTRPNALKRRCRKRGRSWIIYELSRKGESRLLVKTTSVLLPSSTSVQDSGNDVVVVAQLDKAQIQGEHAGTINLGAVDGFLGSLRHCATNIHRRIIVLQHSSSRDSEDDRSIQALFNSHLLGFELGLAPAYVSYLSQDRRIQGLQRWWHMRTYPSLMFGQIGKTAKIALYLGRRSFGDGSPYTSECM
jgi:hypothetical protein